MAHRAANFEEAEAWDLAFWQNRSPEQRLFAFAAIRRDVDKVMKGRLAAEKAARKDRTHNPRHQDDVRVLREVRRCLKRTKLKGWA